jgi:hypothetical protein
MRALMMKGVLIDEHLVAVVDAWSGASVSGPAEHQEDSWVVAGRLGRPMSPPQFRPRALVPGTFSTVAYE